MVKKNKGWTLVELLIVLVIISILAAFAVTSYQKYVVRTKRTEVQAEMMRVAQQLQSYLTVNHSYQNATIDKFGLSLIGTSAPFPSLNNKSYDLTLVIGSDNQTWTLTATPAGSQLGNGSVSLNSLSQKCWTKGATCTPTATSNWDGK